MNKAWLDNSLERILWTLVYVVTTGIIQAATDLEWKYVLLMIPMLNVAKVLAARKVGDPNTGAIGGEGGH